MSRTSEEDDLKVLKQAELLTHNIARQNERINELTGILADIYTILEAIERNMRITS